MTAQAQRHAAAQTVVARAQQSNDRMAVLLLGLSRPMGQSGTDGSG
jgi:hypothetical protein